ncbi:unnamed protein product [Linum tenue]|uniref:Uncharacterized protein n=1 Tax=Linum tenue TaxID=586396 RepID=A0AAV0L1E8_9ROSI|nr:unnamed protein product [Linum tenue]
MLKLVQLLLRMCWRLNQIGLART